ncbi:MAG: Hsp20/alpha crystallin family protein [Candidatus Binatia bacterium]
MGRSPYGWDEDIQRLGERVDDFFDRVLGLAATPRYGLQQTWRPSLDMYRVEDGFAVIADLAGVDDGDLHVSVDNGRLRIAGARRPALAGPSAEPLQLEIDYGPFERVIALPVGVDGDRITAEFHDGLLVVHVPMRDPGHAVRVQVATPDRETRGTDE